MTRALSALEDLLVRVVRWPVVWYFRPSQLAPGLQDPMRRWQEISSAAIGGMLWAGLLGLGILRIAGGIEVSVTILPILVTFATMGSSLALAGVGALASARVFSIAVASVVAGALAIVGLCRYTFGASDLAFAVVVAVAVAGLVAVAGAVAISGSVTGVVVGTGSVALTDAVSVACRLAEVPGPVLSGLCTTATFLLLSSLVSSFCIGRRLAYTAQHDAVEPPGTAEDLCLAVWSCSIFSTLGLLTGPMVVNRPGGLALDGPWESLAFAGAGLATGLPWYPFVSAIQLWQCRASRRRQFRPEDVGRFVASRWQSFIYPLPGIRSHIVGVARQHGLPSAWRVIRTLQASTMQTLATSRATMELARDQDLGLAFTALVASHTNRATLMSLALSSPFSRCLAIVIGAEPAKLSPPLGKERSEPQHRPWVHLDLPRLPGARSFLTWRPNRRRAELFTRLGALQRTPLLQRADAALTVLEVCQPSQGPALRDWILAARRYVQVTKLVDYRPAVTDSLEGRSGAVPSWLAAPWRLLGSVEEALAPLVSYRCSAVTESRLELLEGVLARLKQLLGTKTSWLWAALLQELVAHFASLVSREIAQVNKLLKLAVKLPEQRLRVGRTSLKIVVRNPTKLIARDLSLSVQACPGISWGTQTLSETRLEDRSEIELAIPFTSEQPGDYLIEGSLSGTCQRE